MIDSTLVHAYITCYMNITIIIIRRTTAVLNCYEAQHENAMMKNEVDSNELPFAAWRLVRLSNSQMNDCALVKNPTPALVPPFLMLLCEICRHAKRDDDHVESRMMGLT